MIMSRSNPTVLVIGAAGRFAGLVVPELARRGAAVRAFVRNEAKADFARRNGAAEVAIGDLRDEGSLEAAMQGVDGVFHIGPAFLEDEAELGVRVVEAAKRNGVRKFVFSSVIHPTDTRLANHRSKVPVEDAIFASGMDYTILHPATFFQTIAGAWPSVVERGVFAEPFPTKSRIARVDYRDVAEAAAMAFTDDRLAYGTFELCAAMVDREEIAAIMSDVLGRRIEAVEVRFEDWAARLPLNERQKEFLAKIYASYAAYGSGGNSLTLRAVLGREPRSLRQFIEELPSG
jgi:uncharacterized protein YbjT (DUF2867 family)